MEGMLACLRGWHPGLAFAELAALLPNATLERETSERWVRISGAEQKERREALDVASGLQCFLVNGYVASTEERTIEDWLTEMQAYLHDHPVSGSVAVRAWKQGSKLPGWSLSNLSGRLGGLLHDAGCTIDLDFPDHVLALISDGSSGSLACGWMEGDGQAAFSNGERRAGERPFFKPVSLDPMLARLAVNLAAGPLGRGPVVDPMTGTGGFLIEASLSGRPSLGIDIHSEMVQGAQANLAWAHGGEAPAHASVVRGDATRLQDVLPDGWHGNVAGFVLDPPYGRNSHGTVAADRLLEGCLHSAREVSHPQGGFVLILPIHPLENHTQEALSLDHAFAMLHGEWSATLSVVERCGWQPVSVHVERVHRSLSRLILHARCAPQG
ncbi:MAG: TRM11 family SAM-dependent methyltransferase [Poseidonia sp.]